MSDLIEFFLKTEAGPQTEITPPYLLHFQMRPDDVPEAVARAEVLLPMLVVKGGFGSGREAAEAAISSALVNESHLEPRLQQMIAALLVYLIDASQEGKAAIERRAEKIGFLFRPGLKTRLDGVGRAAAGGGIGVVPVHGAGPSLLLRIVE